MKEKEHQIKTIRDIIDCTNESNLDDFLTDLKAFLTALHALRTLGKAISESAGLPKHMRKMENKGFTWIDDGKNEAKITIK